jgi:hypothetical protein
MIHFARYRPSSLPGETNDYSKFISFNAGNRLTRKNDDAIYAPILRPFSCILDPALD